MNSRIWARVITLSLLAALGLPGQLSAQQKAPAHHRAHHYRLIDKGTFGGPASELNPGSGNDISEFTSILNPEGTVAGFADTALADPFQPYCFWDCTVTHTFRAQSNGQVTDLGALPGGGSSAPTWITANGLIAGVSENGETDPLYPGLPELHAVLWQHGKITDLGTLPEGGNQSEANAVNSAGQVVGAALNTVPDQNSMQAGTFWLWGGDGGPPPYPYQERAFLWDQQNGMQDLGTLPGGTDAEATLINERGQVVGYSYTSSAPSSGCLFGFSLTTGSFVWDEKNGMQNLGSLGGTCTAAFDINNRGQIIGASNLSGDQSQHAFLWENGLFQDLGGSLGGVFTGAFVLNEGGQAVGFATLPGDVVFHATLWTGVGHMTDLGVVGNDQCSYATGINAEGQVAGGSISDCTAEEPTFRAFLWEDGSIFDLNALIPPGSPLYLEQVETINDRGEIAGTGVDASGNGHAFLLIPCDENHPQLKGCDYSLVNATAATTPARVAPSVPSVRPQLPSLLQRPVHRGPLHSATQAAPDPSQGSATIAAEPQAGFLRDSLSPVLHGRGYCLVTGADELNGYCHAGTPWVCWAGHSSSCPTGAKALKPVRTGCGLNNNALITDAGRPCSF